MKQLKKTVVLAALAVMMAFAVQKDAEAATPENLVMNKAYSFEFERYDESLKYTVNLPQSGTLNISMDVTDSQCGHLRLYDISDTRFCNKEFTGDDEHLHNFSFDLLAGTYTLQLTAGNGFTGSFSAMFIPSGETTPENYMSNNNQFGTATPCTMGSTVKGFFAKNDNVDVYKLNVTKDGYLTVRCSSNIKIFDLNIDCLDPKVAYEQYDIPVGTTVYKYFVPKGTYYLSFHRDGYTGTYTFSTELSGITVTKVKSAKNLKGRKAKITWVKKNDVDGYQVQVARDTKFKKGKKTKTITQNTTKSYTFTKLKKKKTYYARVRTYKLVDGQKIYSDWSAPKKFKVKK